MQVAGQRQGIQPGAGIEKAVAPHAALEAVGVGAIAAIERVGAQAAGEQVIARSADEQVAAVVADQRVVAVAAVDAVVRRATNDAVAEVPAGDVDGARTGDIVERRIERALQQVGGIEHRAIGEREARPAGDPTASTTWCAIRRRREARAHEQGVAFRDVDAQVTRAVDTVDEASLELFSRDAVAEQYRADALAVVDDVATVAQSIGVGVIPRAAAQQVVASATGQAVVALVAVERVAAGTTVEQIGARAAAQQVGARAAHQHVGTAVAEQGVGPRAAGQRFVGDTAVDEQGRGQARQQVGLGQHAAIGERIQGLPCVQAVGLADMAHRFTRCAVGEREVLHQPVVGDVVDLGHRNGDVGRDNAGAKREGADAAHVLDGVVAIPGVETIGIVAGATVQQVVVAPADDDVVTVQADQGVVARQAIDTVASHDISGTNQEVAGIAAVDIEALGQHVVPGHARAVGEFDVVEQLVVGGVVLRQREAGGVVSGLEAGEVNHVAQPQVDHQTAAAELDVALADAFPQDDDALVGADVGALRNQRAVKVVRVVDGLDAVASIENVDVAAGAAIELVIARAADQNVIAVAAIERVGAGGAEQDVIAAPAADQIVAATAIENVIALRVGRQVFAIAGQGVVAVATDQYVASRTTEQDILSGATIEIVRTRTTKHPVVAAPAIEQVGTAVEGVAGALRRGLRLTRPEAVRGNAIKLPVDIAQHVPGLGHRDRILRLPIAIENIVAGATDQDVAPRTPHQEIGCNASDDQVVAVAAADQFATAVLGDGSKIVAHGDRGSDALRDITVNQVVTRTAIDQVAADIAQGDAVGPPFNSIRASAGADPVASCAALNLIVATVRGIDRVVATRSEYQVVVGTVPEIVVPVGRGCAGFAHRIAVVIVERAPLLVQRVLKVAKKDTRDRAFDRRIAVNQANPEVAVAPVLERDRTGPYAAIGQDEADDQVVVTGEIALPVLGRHLGKNGASVQTVPSIRDARILEKRAGHDQGAFLFGTTEAQAAGERSAAFGDAHDTFAIGVSYCVVAVAGFSADIAFEEAVLVDVDALAAFFVVVAFAAFDIVRASTAV